MGIVSSKPYCMRIVKTRSREAAISKAIEKLNECLLSARRKPVLLMLSGGSTLELLEGVDMRLIGKRVTITVLDERFSKDPAVNNFSQVCETEFYKKAEFRGIDYIDTRVHRDIRLYALARKFERALRRWRKKHPAGRILITQGIGEDGHTAGILPYPESPKKFNRLFEKGDRWVVAYNAKKEKNEYPRRVTVNLPFLRDEVNCSVVYATSSAKRKAVRRVFARHGNLVRTPARVIREMKEAMLFTDLK